MWRTPRVNLLKLLAFGIIANIGPAGDLRFTDQRENTKPLIIGFQEEAIKPKQKAPGSVPGPFRICVFSIACQPLTIFVPRGSVILKADASMRTFFCRFDK